LVRMWRSVVEKREELWPSTDEEAWRSAMSSTLGATRLHHARQILPAVPFQIQIWTPGPFTLSDNPKA
jgi:hypothetical protein